MSDSKYLREYALRMLARASQTHDVEVSALLTRKARENLHTAEAMDAKTSTGMKK
jgi:hypothetical protein